MMTSPIHGAIVQKVDTRLNADAVEWCPHQGIGHFLLCGTYKLQESTETESANDDQPVPEQNTDHPDSKQSQVRDGAVLVYSLSNIDEQPSLELCASVEMCGVLDIKWSDSTREKPVFGLVNAEGFVQLMHLDTESIHVEQVAAEHLSESSLGLSLDWARVSNSENRMRKVAASDSAGYLSVFDVGDCLLTRTDTWEAHGYEAWITAFHNDENVLFSGGDDCKLKQWDLRDTTRPTMVSRRHQMGVTSIQTHPLKEHIFASGSYDEELLVWDDRNLKSPVTSTNLGGGIWRIKWEPSQGLHILTATMYNGTHIVDCADLSIDPLPIVAVYDDHNLAYGADWCQHGFENKAMGTEASTSSGDTTKHQIRDSGSFLIATCSFYDHALHLWSWNGKDENKSIL